jgi:hypothetical protein
MEILAADGGKFVRRQNFVVVVARIGGHTNTNLAEVAEAIRPLSFVFGSGESGQKHGSQDRDNGDHDEKFDQREAVASLDC